MAKLVGILCYMHTREQIGPSARVELVDSGHNYDPVNRFEIIELPVSDYVKLAQIRGERNPVTGELKASIMAEGLLYEPISACVSEELLTQYITFVNKLWGSNSSIDDFAANRQENGSYYLIVAGHSRHQAFEELIQEKKLPEGQTLPTRMAKVSTVWDIIQLQRADNIHSAPPKERNAMATIEAYEWGLQQGDWKNMSEFATWNKKSGKEVSTTALREMQYFAKLPGSIRVFILGKNIPYSVGVEMGRAVDHIRRYFALEAGYEAYDVSVMAPEHKVKIDQLVAVTLNRDCIRIADARGKATIAAAKALVRSTAERHKNLADELASGDGASAQDVKLFELEDPLDPMLEAMRKAVRAELGAHVNANNGKVVRFVKHHLGGGSVSPAEVAGLAADIEAQAAAAGELRKAVEERRRAIDGGMGSLSLAAAEMALRLD